VKRWWFHSAAVLSLLLSIAAAAAWAMSHARPGDWHLLAIAHSADLRRVHPERRTVVLMMPARSPSASPYGYWDAWWALSRSGRLTLVAQVVDYEGRLGRVYASPPSLLVELPGPARARAVAFGRVPESHPWARRLGFAWDADVQQVDDRDRAGGPVLVRVWRIMTPWWFLVLPGLPLPLLWLRARRRSRRRDAAEPHAILTPMATFTVTVLRDLLQAALRDKLRDGWFYLRDSSVIDLSAPVLLITDTDDLEDAEAGIARAAEDRGFPHEGLDTATLISIAHGAGVFAAPPSDDLLLEAFLYYYKFDAFLPRPGAPDPPPAHEIINSLDRTFYDSLGAERAGIPCREPGCTRGSVEYSVLCRPHHFESVKRKASPFRH
jgi:hypothetical protein